MVAWYTKIHSAEFIGFAPNMKCDKCHNMNYFETFQQYTQMKPYSIIPTPKIYLWFFVRCPICREGTMFKKKAGRDTILELLEIGKQKTKDYMNKITEKERNSLLKGLNRNKFSDLAIFLSFGASTNNGRL